MLNRAINKITFIMAAFALLIALVRQPLVPSAAAQLAGTSISTWSGAPGDTCGASASHTPGSLGIEADNGHIWTCSGTTWTDATAAAAGVPSGFTGMITSGSCPSGYAQVTALDAAMPEGTLAAHGDIGGTGGANSITPTVATLTAAAQAFSGSSATTSAVSAGTPAGTNGTVTGPAQAISWPVGVPTFAGSSGTVPAETFTGNSVTSSAVSAGTPAGTNGATTTSGNTAATNIAAGTGSLTAAKATAPNLTVPAETFTGSALATHTHTTTATGSNGTVSFTPSGTVAWPAGVPTNATSTIPAEAFTGSVLATHTHTLTATGTNGTSSVTGTLNSFDNRPAYVKVIYCQKS